MGFKKMLRDITELLKYIISVCLACSLVTLLLSKTRFNSAVRYVAGIIVLLSVVSALSPLISAVGELVTIDFDTPGGDTDIPGDGTGDIIDNSAVYICRYTKTLISQRFGIPEEDISVSVSLDSTDKDNIQLRNVTVSLPKDKAELFTSVADYVSLTLGCGCTVIESSG